MTFTFFVKGRPVSQGNMRRSPHGLKLYDATMGIDAWREFVTWTAKQALRQASHQGWMERVERQPVILTAEYIFPRLKGHPKHTTPPMVVRPDGGKLQRSIEDAMTDARVWRDDCQVVEWHGIKRYAEVGETPGVKITVESA